MRLQKVRLNNEIKPRIKSLFNSFCLNKLYALTCKFFFFYWEINCKIFHQDCINHFKFYTHTQNALWLGSINKILKAMPFRVAQRASWKYTKIVDGILRPQTRLTWENGTIFADFRFFLHQQMCWGSIAWSNIVQLLYVYIQINVIQKKDCKRKIFAESFFRNLIFYNCKIWTKIILPVFVKLFYLIICIFWSFKHGCLF